MVKKYSNEHTEHDRETFNTSKAYNMNSEEASPTLDCPMWVNDDGVEFYGDPVITDEMLIAMTPLLKILGIPVIATTRQELDELLKGTK